MNTEAQSKVGLVLSGGGAKGAYQAGVVRYLAEADIPVAAVSGASIGGINGAVIAAAPTLDHAAKRLNGLWQGLISSTPAQLQIASAVPPIALGLYLTLLLGAGHQTLLSGLAGNLANRALRQAIERAPRQGNLAALLELLKGFQVHPEILQNRFIEERLDTYLDEPALRDGLPLYLSVFRSAGPFSDLASALLARIGVGDTRAPDFLHLQDLPENEYRPAILASAAVPLLLESQAIDGIVYADGGLGGVRHSTGLTPAEPLLLNEECTHLIIVHLRDGALWDRHRFPNAVILEIRPEEAFQKRGPLSDTFGFDPNSLAAWIDQGYSDARRCLEAYRAVLTTLQTGKTARETRDRAIGTLLQEDALDRIQRKQQRP